MKLRECSTCRWRGAVYDEVDAAGVVHGKAVVDGTASPIVRNEQMAEQPSRLVSDGQPCAWLLIDLYRFLRRPRWPPITVIDLQVAFLAIRVSSQQIIVRRGVRRVTRPWDSSRC
jgi:hypothetical protein